MWPRPWQPLIQNQTAMPTAKARKVPDSNNMHDSEGDGGGSSSQTGGGFDPPDAERESDWQCMEDATGPGPGRVFWQYLSSMDKRGTCSWQDFNPERSDNVEGAFSECQRGAKNVVNLHIPDEIWSTSKKKTSTTY